MMFPFQCRFTSGISIRHSWQHRRVPPEFIGTFNVCGFRSFPQLSNKNMSFSGKGWICIGWKHIDDDRDRKFEGTRPLVNYNIDMDWETKPWWLFIYCVYIYIYIEFDACPVLYLHVLWGFKWSLYLAEGLNPSKMARFPAWDDAMINTCTNRGNT